jgi:nitrogen fixation NifU-like protein
MARYGLPATSRASFYVYNLRREVDFLADSLDEVIRAYAPRPVAVPDLPAAASVAGALSQEPDDDLFREVVLDHYLHPAGREPVDHPQVEWHGKNPLCGDEVTLRLRLDADRIVGLQVTGHGCSISVASGSMLASALKGRTLDEARRLLRGMKSMFKGEPLPADLDLGDLEALQGVKDLPVRVKCALLPWTTFEEGIDHAAQAADDHLHL